MMDDQDFLFNRVKPGAPVVGVLLGALLGVATSLSFLLLIIGLLLGVGAGALGLRGSPAGRSRAAMGGGMLIGQGAVYLCGALNTLSSNV